jgi:hypothetical protein
MKLNNINFFNNANKMQFRGHRLDKNAVAQLSNNNPFSLTEPNQRYITNSIDNLSKISGDKNLNFLLNTAAQNKYSTNIALKELPKNNWRTKLLAAAAAVIAITPFANSKLVEKFQALSKPQKLTKEEKEILKSRTQLLQSIDLQQIQNETTGTERDFEKNLDAFVISSETTLEHKKYVLDKLNYFMSDKYEINPQLIDKKSIAVAEMVNDMAINTGGKIPNIKAVNQKQHGMCAAISIVRKKLAYEDKPNYVDSILSELDSSHSISVYDRNALGSGKKTLVEKVPVDFEAALAKGYRIIDASTMHWMQIATMSGENNISYNEYNPFDRKNFDVKTDSFFDVRFADEELEKTQAYYQALVKAKSVINNYKANRIEKSIYNNKLYEQSNKSLTYASKNLNKIKDVITEIAPNLNTKDVQKLTSELIKLRHNYSDQIKPDNKFAYIPNEENSIKKVKIANYIKSKTGLENIPSNKIDDLGSLLNEYHSITNLKPQNSKSGIIRKARNLYDVASAFRYQVLVGLNEPTTLINTMYAENIPDKETLILKNIEQLIDALQNNSPNQDLIIEQLTSNAFEGNNLAKNDIINNLKYLQAKIYEFLTTGLDDLYGSLTLGNRKEGLILNIQNLQDEIINGDNRHLEGLSEILNVKKHPKSILKALEADKRKLGNCDDNEYIKIFNKYGNKSQLQCINEIFESYIAISGQDNNKNAIEKFAQANNLKFENDNETYFGKIQEIKNYIDTINKFLDTVSTSLQVVDLDGNVLYSSDPKDVIVKKLENEGRLISARQLRELQTHFEKIDKDKSSDEFQSRQGKLKDTSLYQFSKQELATLKEIEKNINPMRSYVQKQLNYVQSNLRIPLEELKRQIGVNNGDYWVREEGESGLGKDQQIRILEYMTGRPHYVTTNLKEAFEKIKTSPYSGITTSSIYHDRVGIHAQYVADIAPVNVNIKDNNGNNTTETREVLFHDNSWGASEKENTWVDSLGLTRTDYSDNRGGSQGYITNEKYRNGNLVSRILDEMVLNEEPPNVESRIYKKIKPDRECHSMPQYQDVILDGKSPDIKSVSDKIHAALFIPNVRQIGKLKKLIATYSEEEVQQLITNNNEKSTEWKDTYQILKNRIFGISNGTNIHSKEDYDKLKNDDYLKVVLEKIALQQRYQVVGLEPDIAKVKNVKDLAKYSAAQKNRAINSFKYSFSKSLKVVDFLDNSYGKEQDDAVEAILNKYGIVLSDDDFNSISSIFDINIDQYNGSAKNTINLIMENLNKSINKVISDKNAKSELKKYFRTFLNEKLYFNKSDLDLYEPEKQKNKHLIQFIDRVYNPTDDDEFVSIYRNIQDMTDTEFKKEVLSKVTPIDLGIKAITGYDVLQKIQHYDEDANNSLINTVYYDNFVQNSGDTLYKPEYEFDRFFRNALYTQKRTFESIYRDFKKDLMLLNYQKEFNKYKANNLSKYGSYPAYPKTNLISEERLQQSFNNIVDCIEENVQVINVIKEQLKNYQLLHCLKKLKKQIPANNIIDGADYISLNKIFGELATINNGIDSVIDTFTASNKALDLPEGSKWSDYKKFINVIIKQLSELEKISPADLLNATIEEKREATITNKHAFVSTFIQSKHKSAMENLLNRFEQESIKGNSDKSDKLKKDLFNFYKEFHILQNPTELLDRYVKSCAKDSSEAPFNNIYEQLLHRALDYSKLIEIQEIIMDAIGDGMAISAKDSFNKHKLSLGSGDNTLMGSDVMIAYMTNLLITDNQFDTALMFLEKLGLSETYVNYMSKNINIDELKKLTDEEYKISEDFKMFQSTIQPYIDYILEELKSPKGNYIQGLESLRKSIIDNYEKCNMEKACKNLLLVSIDTIKLNFLNNKKAPKELIFHSIMDSALQEIANNIQEKIREKSQVFNSSTTIINLINQVMLPNNSSANDAREKLNEEFSNLYEHRKNLFNLQDDENSDKI